MYYTILNYTLERKIDKLRPVIKGILNRDLQRLTKLREEILKNDNVPIRIAYGSNTDGVNKDIDLIRNRLGSENKYLLLMGYFKNDSKRRYMVNHNYIRYLLAIQTIYYTSEVPIPDTLNINSAMAYFNETNAVTAPARFAINEVEKFFNGLIEHYGLSIQIQQS